MFVVLLTEQDLIATGTIERLYGNMEDVKIVVLPKMNATWLLTIKQYVSGEIGPIIEDAELLKRISGVYKIPESQLVFDHKYIANANYKDFKNKQERYSLSRLYAVGVMKELETMSFPKVDPDNLIIDVTEQVKQLLSIPNQEFVLKGFNAELLGAKDTHD